ncbi:MAG: nucleotidyltransferase domain-containing protein [Deferrisomatales bacterium]|nr:nucleotidyltransferase domain-containing protein [Deferrisomatales bacterium]
MLTRSQIERLRVFFEGRQEVTAAYLFGSEATGRQRRGSDVDLALMARREIRGFERVNLETELSSLLGRDVDVVIFGQASPLLKHQILRYGVRVYESDARERVRQEVAGRYEYLDTRFLHRELRG